MGKQKGERIVILRGTKGMSGYTPESLCEKYKDRVVEDGRLRVDDTFYCIQYVDDRIKHGGYVNGDYVEEKNGELLVWKNVTEEELFDIWMDRHCRTRSLVSIHIIDMVMVLSEEWTWDWEDGEYYL